MVSSAFTASPRQQPAIPALVFIGQSVIGQLGAENSRRPNPQPATVSAGTFEQPRRWAPTFINGGDPVKALNMIALALIIIGGINWGLMGLFQFDLVAAIFGGQSATLARIVYILVGLAALYAIYLFKPLSVASERHHSVRTTTR
jgi:hypothetical protein